MPRVRSPQRFDTILEAATAVFAECGYRLARIAEVARRAGVSPATVHLYAASKEALFDLVLRRALHDPGVNAEALPYRLAATAPVVERTWERLLATADFPILRGLAPSVPVGGADAELREVLREAYRWLRHHRHAILIIERCALDWPDLAALFETQFRRGFAQRLAAHLERRTAQGVLRPTADASTAAQVLVASISHFGLRAPSLTHAGAEGVVLDLLTAALRVT